MSSVFLLVKSAERRASDAALHSAGLAQRAVEGCLALAGLRLDSSIACHEVRGSETSDLVEIDVGPLHTSGIM